MVDRELANYLRRLAPLRYSHRIMGRPLNEFSRLFSLAAIVAILASCAPLTQASKAGTVQQPVEHASADDCAIIAAIGRHELHWSSTKAPAAYFYPRFDSTGGRSYLEDCSWGKIHLATPAIGATNSPIGFFITRPVYSRTGASAYFQYSVAAVSGSNGTKIAPFIEQQLCTLEKDAAGWHLIRCKLTAIS